eukprot:TRINITY_DN8693_c0_g1_i4.p1 TRINITY_DN8693_c0_g1~~TRINITY_DN8693_c0_g1_i4.p1  ORF type:complete len:616 (-),score=197.67 TRINITY_DN8693_c0_g1_i4:15-1862(-)
MSRIGTGANQKFLASINSNDRDERIAARRARIKARVHQSKSEIEGKEDLQEPTLGSGEKMLNQIQKSKIIFSDQVEKAIDEVNTIKKEASIKEEERSVEWERHMTKYKSDRQSKSQDATIAELTKEIKVREEEYVKSLNRQAEEIDALLKRMRTNHKTLVSCLEEELGRVENLFEQERTALRQQHSEELDQLAEFRRVQEVKFMELKQERMQESRKQIEEMRTMEAEEYHETKVKLETDIQVLEQHFQTLKATFQLNNEKLDHNFRVLGEKEFEHTQQISQQKKKLARLQDMLTTLKAKYGQTDKKFRNKNMELTDEYKRVTEQYKDLQSKFKHFQDQDRQKYREIWEMNVERVAELVEKLLKADKITSEQQLGWKWQRPSADIFQLEREHPRNKDKANLNSLTPNTGLLRGDSLIYRQEMRGALKLICDEAGFLVEQRAQDLIDGITTEIRNMVQIDSILNALGIETSLAAEQFLTYFVKDEDQLDALDPQLIPKHEVLPALKKFVEDHQTKIKEVSMEALVSTEEEKKEKLLKIKEREFWERLATVVPDETHQVWQAFEKELMKYHTLLNERATLLDDSNALHQQNNELKVLLNQYLNSKINQELFVPPVTIS